MNIKEVSLCRACGETLTPVVSFGEIPVINMGDKEAAEASLELMYCPSCTLLQLHHTVDREDLFRNYYYMSRVNKTIRDNLEEIVREATRRVELKTGDLVIDIGANDGTLLSYYPKSLERCGFEPAENLKSGDSSVHWCPDFFAADRVHFEFGGKEARVISAVSMFYDLDDPNTFLKDIKRVLAPDGLFVIQQNYLPAMLQNNAFDNVVHEHLCYYSVRSLMGLLLQHGLIIEEVEFNPINGGSFRTYVRHNSGEFITKSTVGDAAKAELDAGLTSIQTYKEFGHKVEVISHKLRRLLQDIYGDGKLVYLAGASTRGNTLLNVAGITEYIKFAVERNPAKHGKTYNGIPIVSEEFAQDFPPDYYLILPWHFWPELLARERDYMLAGGKMILPLPYPHVVEFKKL